MICFKISGRKSNHEGYEILPKTTLAEQPLVSCFQLLLVTRLSSGIKSSLELGAGAGKAADGTGQYVRSKKYVTASHCSSWEKTLQVNARKACRKLCHRVSSLQCCGIFFLTSEMIILTSPEYFWFSLTGSTHLCDLSVCLAW